MNFKTFLEISSFYYLLKLYLLNSFILIFLCFFPKELLKSLIILYIIFSLISLFAGFIVFFSIN